MAVVDPQSLLGDYIPSVYISRILLETSGQTLVVDNPHIDSSKENTSLIEQKNKTSKSLSVTVNLVVKEKITADNNATWFDKYDLTKYVDIKLFQSTDPKLTEILSSGIDMLDLVDPTKTVSQDDIRYLYAGYVYETDDIDTLNQKFLKNSSYKQITLNKGKNLLNSIDDFKSYTDDSGNQYYDITYVVNFILPNESPQHLSYFAVSSFNIEELSKDYKLKLDSANLQELVKKISSDIVIENEEVVGKSYIFYDNEGKIWAGPTTQADDQNWYTGIEITENSKPLTRSIVSNSKVQDNRNFKKLSLNVENLYNKLLNNNTIKLLTNNSTAPSKKQNYISNLMIARSPDGDSKFIFTINLEKIITEKSVYGNLIKSSKKLKEEILKTSLIKNLTLYRKRVKQESFNYTVFDSNEPIDFIVNSRDTDPGKFISVNNDRASMRESFVITNNEKQYLRYFTGIDKTMSDITTGLYQYHAELEIEDGTIGFVENQIELLLLAKIELQKYYETSVIPGVSREQIEIQDPHIKHPLEITTTKQYQSSYYDPTSNQFTQEFEKAMKQKYPEDNLLLAPWISAISVYVSVLDVFTDFLDSVVQRQKYLKDLYAAVSPSTGNPQGIMIVMSMIDTMISMLSKSIGASVTVSPRKFGNSSQKVCTFSRSSRETIKVTKIFDELFDSDAAKDFAYDYLSIGEDDTNNDDGIKVITGEEFSERMSTETLKYFNNADDSLVINFAENNFLINDSLDNTGFTYITPTRIDTPKKSYILTKNRRKRANVDIQDLNQESRTTQRSSLSKDSIFKTKKTKKVRVIENISDTPENTENKLLKINSEIMFSSISGRSSRLLSKNVEDNRSVSSKSELKNVQENKNADEIDEALTKILSDYSNVVLEKNLIITEEKFRRVQRQQTSRDIKKNKLNVLIKNKIDVNKQKETGKNNTVRLLDMLVKPMANNNMFDKRLIKKVGINRPSKNKILNQSILNIKSTELRASRDSSGRIAIDGLRKTITEEKFRRLPNHIKRIFVKNEKTPPSPILSTPSKPSEIFDYSLLSKIEYLDGFEINDIEEIILNKPIWKELTKSVYKSKIGRELLCRIVKYEDSDVGIQKVVALEKPRYDEVFILIPENIAQEEIEIKPVKIQDKKITQRIVSTVQAAIPGVRFVELPSTTSSIVSSAPAIVSNILPAIEIPTLQSNNFVRAITIIEENNLGQQITKKFALNDGSSIVNAIQSLPKNINVSINNTEVRVPVKAASEIIALQSQANLIKTDLISNNQVSNKKIADQVKQQIKNVASATRENYG